VEVVDAGGRAYPSWFELTLLKRDALMGRMVGRVGSARHWSSVELDGGALAMQVAPQYEPLQGPIVWRGALEGGVLRGTTVGDDGRPATWTARRAPELRREEPRTWDAPEPLFVSDGDLDRWRQRYDQSACWHADGGVLANVTPCVDLVSKDVFDDFRLHAEFKLPPGGNSGLYLRGRYEVQLDAEGDQRPDSLRHGGIYGFVAPRRLAARASGEWQSVDVTLVGRRVTVVMNGELVIDREEIPGPTGGALDSREGEPGPIMLQGDHTAVEYRNIVITPGK
jgi:hypothetical protein